MPDAKGTYYSPQESGWATVLRPGPNFMGMAQQAEANRMRREQLVLQQKAKDDAARETAIGKIVADISKPVPTAYPYMEEVGKRKQALQDQVQKMYLEGKDAMEIRAAISNGVQDMMSYAGAGTQIYGEAEKQIKSLDPKKYRIDKIGPDFIAKMVGADGKVVDPSKVDPRDMNVANMIYESELPGKYMNAPVVIKDFLKNDKFKQVAMEIQQKVDEGKLGRFTTVGKETTINKYTGGLYEVEGMTGNLKVLDPETLIKNGVFQLMMDEKDMLAVVDLKVHELTEDWNNKPEGSNKDLLRASVLHDLLINNTPGTQTVKRISEQFLVTNASSGGRLPQWMQQEAAVNEGTTAWESDATSRSLPLVKEAIMFSAKKGGISTTSLSPIHELTGADPESEITNVTFTRPGALEKSVPYAEMDPRQPWADRIPDEHKLFIEFKKPGRAKGNWVEIDQRSLSDERTRAALNKLQEGVGYGYKQRNPNPINPNTVSGGQQQSTTKKKIGGF